MKTCDEACLSCSRHDWACVLAGSDAELALGSSSVGQGEGLWIASDGWWLGEVVSGLPAKPLLLAPGLPSGLSSGPSCKTGSAFRRGSGEFSERACRLGGASAVGRSPSGVMG